MPKKISLGHITEAEKELVRRERYRLSLDTKEWDKEPFITDYQLMDMSDAAAWAHILSRPKVWHRDEHAHTYRNVAHPDNTQWYMQKLAVQLSDGSLEPDGVLDMLQLLPQYQKG